MSIHLRRDGFWAGHPCYLVMQDGGVLGRVYRRDGGWWGWQSNNVNASGSQMCSTRKEAVRAVVQASLVDSDEPAEREIPEVRDYSQAKDDRGKIRMSLRKTTTVEKPHATFRDDASGWEWWVLKTYRSPVKERCDPHAVWYLAVRSPFTHGSWEYGDGYVRDVGGTLIQATDEWREAYGERGRP